MRVKVDTIIEMLAGIESIDDLYDYLASRGCTVSRRTLYNWRHGRHGFNSAKVQQVAQTLGLDPKAIIQF